MQDRAARVRVIAAGALIFALFFAVYRHYGYALSSARPFDTVTLFAMDVQRTIRNMTVFEGVHRRSSVHPIYVLLVNPIGSWLNGTPWPQQSIAIALNNAIASAAVVVLFAYVYVVKRSLQLAALLAALFGFSMSHLVVGSVPETYSLAALTLLATHLLFVTELRRRRLSLARWIAAGVLTLGVTTTNLAQTAICVGLLAANVEGETAAYDAPKRWRRVATFLLVFGTATIAMTVVLALVQKYFYPTAELFFDPAELHSELQYAHALLLEDPLLALEQLGKNFFVFDLVGPVPQLIMRHGRQAVSFSPVRVLSGIALVAFLSMVAVAGYAVAKRALAPRDRPVLVAIVLCFAFNILLHAYYGMYDNVELFLYSGDFTFLPFLAFAVIAPAERRELLAGLSVLLALFAASNLGVMNRVVAYCT